MKRLIISLALLLSISVGVMAQKPVVVELFTSEGCSSCPAAEDVLAGIDKENNKDIYILEFHVDYWDRLGWTDPFSNAAYSGRQRQYAHFLALQNIYTPQAIVNGHTEFVGSDKRSMQKAIADELTKSGLYGLSISAFTPDQQSVNIHYQLNHLSNNLLNIAIIQLNGQTDVKSGENEGRHLQHIHIVREFKTINIQNEAGNISIAMPKGLAVSDIRVVAYLQDKNNWTITGAAQADIH